MIMATLRWQHTYTHGIRPEEIKKTLITADQWEGGRWHGQENSSGRREGGEGGAARAGGRPSLSPAGARGLGVGLDHKSSFFQFPSSEHLFISENPCTAIFCERFPPPSRTS